MVAIPPRFTQPDDSSESAQTHLPTMYDLPSESLEEPGLPDEFHDLQPQLLSTVSGLNLYYDSNHPQWYKRADWFLAVDVPRLYEERDLRRSYVIWYEKQPPAIVVEFLSEGTEAEDLGRFHAKAEQERAIAPTADAIADASEPEPEATPVKEKPPSKLTVYEEYLRVPHYLVYQRQTQHLRYFQLVEGRYQEQPLNPGNPRVWLEDLAIGLGIWPGVFEGAGDFWLRWCDANGNWLLTDTEQERLAKEQERLAKEQAQAQLLQTARNLMTAGMTIEQVVVIMAVSDEQAQWLIANLCG